MKPDVSGQAWFQLALATVAFALCFMAWGAIAPQVPLLTVRWGLTPTQAGLLVATPVLLGALSRVPLGWLTDRYGGRRVFSILLLVVALPLAAAGLTETYHGLLAVSLVLGLAGGSFAVGVPFVSRWFPPRLHGLALGIYGLGNAGTAIAGAAIPRVAEQLGSRATYWSLLPAILAMAVLFAVLGRDAPQAPPPAGIHGIVATLGKPVAWVLMLFYFLSFGSFVAIGLYLPTFLVGQHGLAASDAGARAAGFIALATLARPVGGYLADRMGGAWILNGVFLLVALLAVVLAFDPGMAVLSVSFLVIAAAVGVGNGAVFKLVAEYFPRETGAAAGLVGAAGGLGGFFPPLLMGGVFDWTGSYAIAFMLLSEFALACFIINVLALQGRARPHTEGG